MANSGGGLLVYGVKEDRANGKSAAGEIRPVGEVGEVELRRMRQMLNNLIYPAVTNMELLPLFPEGQAAEGVLALNVLPSPDVPHLVHPKGEREWFQAPWRNGPDTALMTERQLANEYRRREQNRREHEQDLNDLYDGFLHAVDAAPGSDGPVWVVAVAQPVQPYPDPRRLSKIGAQRFLEYVDNHPWVYQRQWGDKMSPIYLTSGSEVRYGLKKYVRLASVTQEENRTYSARVEVHGNGAVAVGFTRDGHLHRGDIHDGHVAIPDVESVGLDLAAMMMLMVHAGNTIGDFHARIGVSAAPVAFRAPDSLQNDLYRPADQRYQTTGLRPVDGVVVTQMGRTEMLASVTQLIGDAMRQIGTPYNTNAVDLDRMLKGTAFGDIFNRPGTRLSGE